MYQIDSPYSRLEIGKWISAAFILSCHLLAGCGGQSVSKPQFVKQIDWIDQGVWVKADVHNHTKFSDGGNTVREVVDKAVQFGCDVLAITDHGDKNLKAATREYFEAIEVARRKNPKLIIFAGLEWNVPPWGGDEHATVLIDPKLDEWRILAKFKDQFDDLGRSSHKAELADEALRWLEENATSSGCKPVVIYNHPSRKDDKSMENVQDIMRWRQINDLVIGYEGAPGHQRANPLGSYRYKVKTIDRWDPVAAEIGDAWDVLLGKGLDVWAAIANADYHTDSKKDLHDYWPGEFSETWLYVPEKTPAGILKAYHAGSFFATHGHIVREVKFTVEVADLPRPAYPGEVIAVPSGTRIRVKLSCKIPDLDWQGKLNQIDNVELIGITSEGAKSLSTLSMRPNGEVEFIPIDVPSGGIVLRARGRRIINDGPDLLFYTNPIRIKTGL